MVITPACQVGNASSILVGSANLIVTEQKLLLISMLMKCKNCKKETNGNFLKGEFCDKQCARAFKREKKSVSVEQKTPELPAVEDAVDLIIKDFSPKKKKIKKEEE